MSTYGHGAEMQRRLVELLRADTALTDPTTGLLFPAYAPRLDEEDFRIFGVDPLLPNRTSGPVSQLPRIVIEIMASAHPYEQEQKVPGAGVVLMGPVKVWVHTIVNLADEERGERIDAYIAGVILSTALSDARIITGMLVGDGQRRKDRIAAFNGAWEFVSGYATPNAGSLQ